MEVGGCLKVDSKSIKGDILLESLVQSAARESLKEFVSRHTRRIMIMTVLSCRSWLCRVERRRYTRTVTVNMTHFIPWTNPVDTRSRQLRRRPRYPDERFFSPYETRGRKFYHWVVYLYTLQSRIWANNYDV